MMLSLIVAAAENNVIGRDGGLPWHLSADLKRFKQLTMGHTMLMGRRTFDSIGRALPGRISIVISRQEKLELPPGVLLAGSLDEALFQAKSLPNLGAEVFVIGGAELYQTALPLAARLYLTRVHAEIPGDTFFPPIDWSQWHCLEETRHEADDKNPYAFSFQVFQRSEKLLD